MKVGIIGAGAVGGLIGAYLARAGVHVTLVDTGEHRRALEKNGISLELQNGEIVRVQNVNTCDIESAGTQDAVFLAVKAYDLCEVAPFIPSICHAGTIIVPVQNGLPWWYFKKTDCRWRDHRIESLDPHGILERHIDIEMVVCAIVYAASTIVSPGVIRLVEGNRIAIGELDDQRRERTDKLINMLSSSGFKANFVDDLRGEIWVKLIGSAVFNPLSALTHATMKEMCTFLPSRTLAIELMKELQAIAEKLGITLRVSIERRIAGAERVGDHKTSTLQDVEKGLRIEVDALVGSVIEVAKMIEVQTPRLETLAAATYLLDQTIRAHNQK